LIKKKKRKYNGVLTPRFSSDRIINTFWEMTFPKFRAS